MMKTLLNRRLSVAPMMGATDRYFRAFIRTITQHTLLYTEMVTTWALQHGNKQHLLRFDPCEHPLALQLGGNDPVALAECAKLGEDYGYDEINLNIGCPSPRVSANRFGACLMAEPELVADCIQAMQQAVMVPVTVKHRIGIDNLDQYADLYHFVERLILAGCTTFIVHARLAKLHGISPKDNRQIPPLRYDIVYQLKQDFPHIKVILNGGIIDLKQALTHLQVIDGVMLGRAAYNNPWILADADQLIFNADYRPLSRHQVIEAYLPHVTQFIAEGVSLANITRHLLGLFHGEPNSRQWRRILSENSRLPNAGIEIFTPYLKNAAFSGRNDN